MTLKVNCAFCQQVVRVRNDGRVYKHRIPARTTWERGRRPECGGSGRPVQQGRKYRDSGRQMNIHEKILRWMAGGRTGISSKTMALTAVDIPVTGAFGPGYPHDPGDLNRCLGLLEAVPEVRLAFHKIAALSPTWKALIDRWDEIEETFIEEVGTERPRHASADRTYRLMREVIESSGDAEP